jgi:hypothetical protein
MPPPLHRLRRPAKKCALAMFLAKVGPKKRNRKRTARLKAKLRAKNKRRRENHIGA